MNIYTSQRSCFGSFVAEITELCLSAGAHNGAPSPSSSIIGAHIGVEEVNDFGNISWQDEFDSWSDADQFWQIFQDAVVKQFGSQIMFDRSNGTATADYGRFVSAHNLALNIAGEPNHSWAETVNTWVETAASICSQRLVSKLSEWPTARRHLLPKLYVRPAVTWPTACPIKVGSRAQLTLALDVEVGASLASPSQFASWGVSPDEAWRQARQNLADRQTPSVYQISSSELELYVLSGDLFTSGYLLDLKPLLGELIDGSTFAAAPNSTELIVSPFSLQSSDGASSQKKQFIELAQAWSSQSANRWPIELVHYPVGSWRP